MRLFVFESCLRIISRRPCEYREQNKLTRKRIKSGILSFLRHAIPRRLEYLLLVARTNSYSLSRTESSSLDETIRNDRSDDSSPLCTQSTTASPALRHREEESGEIELGRKGILTIFSNIFDPTLVSSIPCLFGCKVGATGGGPGADFFSFLASGIG